MLISIDERDPRPLYVQLATGIKEEIARGALEPGEELPSVRELAESLGINLHTVHHAYRQLRDEGVIQLRLGKRAKVASLRSRPASGAEIEARLAGRLNELLTEAFHLGMSPNDFKALLDRLLARRSRRGGET